ncbi:MAG: hypothetical protein N2559_01125 [Anaerolineae bacterium]|nr:hypothetical protein [Anaerolineae bacterium]
MPDTTIPALTQTRVLKFARIRRERMLPARGIVMVTAGSRVGALDVIAKVTSAAKLRPVPVARYVRAKDTLEKYLLKQVGEDFAEREIIVSKPEWFGVLRRLYRAPGAGRLAAVQGAWIVLDLASADVELRALYRGTVINVMARQGVLIEATGALAQGVWGAGGEGYGVLRRMVEQPDGIVTEEQIDVSARGTIIIAGAGITEGALRRAAQERVAGVITGGLSPRLRRLVSELQMPTLVTDGFGERAMATPFFDLLSGHLGEEAIVNAPTVPTSPMRPEVFIPILAGTDTGAATPPPTLFAQIGSQVRIVSGTRCGQIGTIAEIVALPRLLESGVQTRGAEISLGSERVFVPWENLELIG